MMRYHLAFLLLLLTLPTVGWAADHLGGDTGFPHLDASTPVEYKDGSFRFGTDTAAQTDVANGPPSPCVQKANDLLRSDTASLPATQANAFRAIALLLLDQRLGADCTVGEP